MTDSVSIDAIGSGLKEWATEETAREIATALVKISKNSDRIIAHLTQKVKETGKTGSKTSVRDMEDELRGERQERKKGTEQNVKNNKELVKKQKNLKKVNSSLKDFAGDLMSLSKGMLGALYASITGGVNAQIDIFKTGASFGNSVSGNLSTLDNTMRAANLTFSDLVKITTEYGSTIAREGTGAFTRYTSSLRKSFVNLGMTSEATAEWIAEYLKGQEKYAYRQNLTEYQQTRMMRQRAAEMEEWSRVLGVSQAQILKSINAEKEKPNVAAFLSTLGPDASKAFEQAMQVVADSPELKGRISDAIADPYFARSELYRELNSQGASEAAAILSQLHDAMQSAPQDVPKLMERFTRSLASLDLEQARVMGEAGRATMAYVGEARRIVHAMEKQGGETRTNVNEQVNFNDSQKAIKVAMQGVATNMNELLPVLSAFNTTLASVINKLNDEILGPLMESENMKKFVDFFRGIDVNYLNQKYDEMLTFIDNLTMEKALGKMGEALSTGVSMLFEELKSNTNAQIIVGGIAALFLAPLIIKSLASVIVSTVGKAVGAALGSGGSAAGRGAAGGMKGIAAGLSFFANPKVLAGGVILGTVIAAIGAGIGAATWLTGKGLGTLAEGMAQLQVLDGERLSAVGKGMGDLAVGLLQFSGARVVETMSGLFSTFAGFFRSKDSNPLVALQQFADASDRLSKPLIKLGEALVVFAPNLKMIAEAFSYDFNFDYKKFNEALMFLSGESPGRFKKGLDPALLGKVATNMEKLTNSSGRLHVATHATAKFAESLMALANSMQEIKNVGDINIEKQIKLPSDPYSINPAFEYNRPVNSPVNAIPVHVRTSSSPRGLSDILPSVKKDPAVSTPNNFVELIDPVVEVDSSMPTSLVDAEVSKAERMLETINSNTVGDDTKLSQLIDIASLQLDMLSRIRKSINDRGI